MKKSKMRQFYISKFNNLRISQQFTVSLLVFLLFPMMILLFWINQNVSTEIGKKNCNTNLEVLKQTRTSITYMISDISYISLEVLGNTDLQNYFISGDHLSYLDKQKLSIDIQYQINNLMNSRDYISRLSVFDHENTFFQFGAYLTKESYSGVDQAKILHGKPLWIPTHMETNCISKNDRVYVFDYIRAINDITKLEHILAYEKISIPEKYLCSLYSGIQSDGTENMFVMDEQGYILSSIDKSLFGKNLVKDNIYQQVQGRAEGYYINQNQLISFYKIADSGWYVIKIDKTDNILSVQMINGIILLCVILTMVFAIIFLYIQRKQIINPVTELSKEVRKFREGQYTITIHKDSQDEIGELNKCFLDMGIYIQDLIENVYNSKLSEKEAQLKYLQSQINPHFLYNTLDSIRWMAIKEKRMDIAIQIEALSNLFKHALNDGKDMTTVEREVEHLKNYITIQKNRLGELLDVKIDVDEEINKQSVLNLILQPLVENAIEHGLENKLDRGEINVSIKHENDMIHYVVEDNGLGTDEQLIQNRLNGKNETRNALALFNINQRIKYKYGEEYGVCFHSEIGVGTKVEIIFPITET